MQRIWFLPKRFYKIHYLSVIHIRTYLQTHPFFFTGRNSDVAFSLSAEIKKGLTTEVSCSLSKLHGEHHFNQPGMIPMFLCPEKVIQYFVVYRIAQFPELLAGFCVTGVGTSMGPHLLPGCKSAETQQPIGSLYILCLDERRLLMHLLRT